MIARKITKDPSTISKEVRRHLVHHVKRDGDRDIPCAIVEMDTVEGGKGKGSKVFLTMLFSRGLFWYA